MNEPPKASQQSVISDEQPSKILEPGVASLDDPAPLVPSEVAAILVSSNAVVSLCRNHRLDATSGQLGPQFVAVIAPVSYQPSDTLHRSRPANAKLWYANLAKRAQGKLYLCGRGGLEFDRERSAVAIGNKHELRALTFFGLSDFIAPFLAAAKVPSIMHSSHFNRPAASSRLRKACHIRSKTPAPSHSCNRRQHVVELPYRLGSSIQGEPVHKTQRIPSKHLRSSAGGRPPLGLFVRGGICGSIKFHWSSVSFRHAILAPRLLGLKNSCFFSTESWVLEWPLGSIST
jgi:hypothetical protein